MRFILLPILMFVLSFQGKSQTPFPFTVKEALVMPAPPSYWMRNYEPDIVEKFLIKGEWKMPEAGQPLFAGGDSLWQSISADSAGWFQDRKLRGSYVYVPLESDMEQVVILEGKSHQYVYVNGVPRIGNRYQYKDDFESWEPKFNFSQMPIELKKGTNHLFFKCNRGRFKATFSTPQSALFFNEKDPTLPDLIAGKSIDSWGAMVLVNASREDLKDLVITSKLGEAMERDRAIPFLPASSVLKVPFKIVSLPKVEGKESHVVQLKIKNKKGKVLAETSFALRVVQYHENQQQTYISQVDGSVQYYSVLPATGKFERKALVLSVHGANVEALNQSGSYYPKNWATIVSPTNRRPYGFNWEDWGRIDAMDVLDIAQAQLEPDPRRIYLTGHSMGGHGAWILGATYPDRFAAIGPSAGWVSFWSYRVRTSEKPATDLEKMMMRAANVSQTDTLAANYSHQGVYILHGGADKVVKPEQARHMDTLLNGFHHDYIYHEEPGQGHWWDLSDEDGTDCVDWPPMFDFFARHARPRFDQVRRVKFVTANPGVSSKCYWVSIISQEKALEFSRINLLLDPGKNRISGTVSNVSILAFEPYALDKKRALILIINGDTALVKIPDDGKLFIQKSTEGWKANTVPLDHKNPDRNGTFKDAFRNHALLVYGTRGTPEENEWAKNKARFDSETFWYQGNGRLEVLPDTEFDQKRQHSGRNIILYGNEQTNAAWDILLGDSPVQAQNGILYVGDKIIREDGLSALFIRPNNGNGNLSVGAVTGTSLGGMKRLNTVPYLYAGFGFPDVVVLSEEGLIGAGFFGNDWSVDSGDFVWED